VEVGLFVVYYLSCEQFLTPAEKSLSGYTIYSLAKGHDINQFVSEREPDLRMYRELM
jgi:hypothetical protein